MRYACRTRMQVTAQVRGTHPAFGRCASRVLPNDATRPPLPTEPDAARGQGRRAAAWRCRSRHRGVAVGGYRQGVAPVVPGESHRLRQIRQATAAPRSRSSLPFPPPPASDRHLGKTPIRANIDQAEDNRYSRSVLHIVRPWGVSHRVARVLAKADGRPLDWPCNKRVRLSSNSPRAAGCDPELHTVVAG